MLLPLEAFRRQAQVREAPQEGLEDNLRLQPDEWRANAEMYAYAKTEVTPFIAGNVKTIRMGKSLWVAVC